MISYSNLFIFILIFVSICLSSFLLVRPVAYLILEGRLGGCDDCCGKQNLDVLGLLSCLGLWVHDEIMKRECGICDRFCFVDGLVWFKTPTCLDPKSYLSPSPSPVRSTVLTSLFVTPSLTSHSILCRPLYLYPHDVFMPVNIAVKHWDSSLVVHGEWVWLDLIWYCWKWMIMGSPWWKY